MNPLDWGNAVRALPRHVDPNHQSGVHNSMESASTAKKDWATYCQYSAYTVAEPQSSVGVDVGWKGPSPPSHNFYIRETEVEGPDGEALQMDEEDLELTRKRNELKEIEEQIIRKKVALALKQIEPLVKEPPPGLSCKEKSAPVQGATLKDRVNAIFQQRHPVSFLSKVRSPKESVNSSSPSKGGLLQEDRPLKLRVQALMKQRCRDPWGFPTNRERPDVPPPPPSRNTTLPAAEENSVNQGFQRFLSVLNKGVDMDLLRRIVNDDSEDLPSSDELLNIQARAAANKSDPPFRSQRSSSGASLPGRSRTNSAEGKTGPPSEERLSLPDDDAKKNDRGDRSLGSSSQTTSPSAVKKKKKNEEENPKLDEQREQLQNILKTLGLSLEVEEMSKLADRTQERLYGKKHEGMSADSREQPESRQKGTNGQYRNSSSSSSSCSSCSSRSTSRSVSPSPSRRQCSRRRDSEQRRTSGDGSRGLRCQAGSQDSKEAPGYRDMDGTDCKETSTYQYPYPQNQTYPHPHPAAFSEFPHYSLSQYSQYNAYPSGTYNAASNYYWTYAQGAIPPSFYPSGYPPPQNSYHQFPGSAVEPNTIYPHVNPLDMSFFVNPDLSLSEGQFGSPSDSRCLQNVSTKQPTTQSILKQLTKGRKRRGKPETYLKNRRLRSKRKKKEKKQLKMAAKQVADSVKKAEAPQGNDGDSKAEQLEEVIQQPTEEEIKANLRKKLEAFNQKVKQKVTQPANSLTPPTG